MNALPLPYGSAAINPPDIYDNDPREEILSQHDAMEFSSREFERLHLPGLLAKLRPAYAEFVEAVQIECQGRIECPDDSEMLSHFLEHFGEAVRVGMEQTNG